MKTETLHKPLVMGKRVLPYAITFCIALVIGLLMYRAKEIAPFGDQSVLCMDLWGQYFSMYVQNAKADSLSELLYSWNGAFGYNNLAQSAYYCNSVFLILFMRLLPVGSMVSALNWFCLLKICFSAVSCLAFLRYKLQKHSPILIAGAVSYGLCAYMLAFYSQFMWTDCLIYLPLVLIGLERLIHQKKPLMYTLLLALTIFSSFYIGFAVCIFSCAYFACNSILLIRLKRNPESRLKVKLTGGKAFGGSIVRFGFFSLLGGAIAAFVILPIGAAIQQTLAAGMEAPKELKWYGDITAILQDLLPERQLSMAYEGVNIATSILVFLSVPIYFFNKEIRIVERIANAVLLTFLLASMNCNLLDYMWHGFHFPNQLPGRWTFMVSLVLVLLGCQGLVRIKGLTPARALLGLCGGFFGLYVTCGGRGETKAVLLGTNYKILLGVAAVLIFTASVAALYARRMLEPVSAAAEPEAEPDAESTDPDAEAPTADAAAQAEAPEAEASTTDTSAADAAEPEEVQMPVHPRLTQPEREKRSRIASAIAMGCALAFSALLIYDCSSNFIAVSKLEINGLPVSNGPGYSQAVERIYENGKAWKCGNDTFYRAEANPGFTFNPSMLGDYHGMGYYSSTMQGSVYNMLRYLGNRVYAERVSSVYNISSPVQNSLFAMRYYLDSGRYLGNVVPNQRLISEGDSNIWENPTVLPVAYAVSDDMLAWKVTDEIRGIQNQNELVNRMCGRDANVFQSIPATQFTYENVELQESDNWNYNYFISQNNDPALFTYVYTCTQNEPVYLEHNFRAGKVKASWNTGSRDIDVGAETYTYLGLFAAGDVITVTASVPNVQVGCCGLNLYHLNSEAWNNAYHQLDSQSLQVVSFKNTKLSGQIAMQQEGLVFASIVQDGGWKVYCDGKELDTVLLGDALLGVRVPAGTHTLEYRYHVPGFALGCCISLVALLLAVWCSCPRLRKKVLPVRALKLEATAPKEVQGTADAAESAAESAIVPTGGQDSSAESAASAEASEPEQTSETNTDT